MHKYRQHSQKGVPQQQHIIFKDLPWPIRNHSFSKSGGLWARTLIPNHKVSRWWLFLLAQKIHERHFFFCGGGECCHEGCRAFSLLSPRLLPRRGNTTRKKQACFGTTTTTASSMARQSREQAPSPLKPKNFAAPTTTTSNNNCCWRRRSSCKS